MNEIQAQMLMSRVLYLYARLVCTVLFGFVPMTGAASKVSEESNLVPIL